MKTTVLTSITLAFAAVALAAITLAACGDQGAGELEKQAQSLATDFHNCIGDRDVGKLLAIVQYPFNYDNNLIISNDEELKKVFFETRMRSIRRAVLSANKLESATYEDFLDGKAINNKSYDDRDAARRQAEKIGFREGGVLVRCYYADEDGGGDARSYYLVMQKDDLGDLKISTYYD